MPLSGRLWAAYSSVVGAAMQLFDARAAPGCPSVLPPTLLPMSMGLRWGDVGRGRRDGWEMVPPQPCVRPSRRSDDGRLCCWQVARQLFLARGYAAPARRSGPNDGGIDLWIYDEDDNPRSGGRVRVSKLAPERATCSAVFTRSPLYSYPLSPRGAQYPYSPPEAGVFST